MNDFTLIPFDSLGEWVVKIIDDWYMNLSSRDRINELHFLDNLTQPRFHQYWTNNFLLQLYIMMDYDYFIEKNNKIFIFRLSFALHFHFFKKILPKPVSFVIL